MGALGLYFPDKLELNILLRDILVVAFPHKRNLLQSPGCARTSSKVEYGQENVFGGKLSDQFTRRVS